MILNNCSNKADLTISGTYAFPVAETPSYASYGGIAGRFSGGNLTLSNVKNSGKVNVGANGKPFSVNTSVLAGGIMGSIAGSETCNYTYTAPIVNTGDITLTETNLGETPDNSFVGGIAGNVNAPISNATSFCNITAVGVKNMGLIMGLPYAEATKATDCKAGGVMCFEFGEYGPEDDPQWGAIPTAINENNFHKYLYGDRGLEASVVKADGCSYISAIE